MFAIGPLWSHIVHCRPPPPSCVAKRKWELNSGVSLNTLRRRQSTQSFPRWGLFAPLAGFNVERRKQSVKMLAVDRNVLHPSVTDKWFCGWRTLPCVATCATFDLACECPDTLHLLDCREILTGLSRGLSTCRRLMLKWGNQKQNCRQRLCSYGS